jgi:hypothetical protein
MKFFYLCCFVCLFLLGCDKKKQEPTPNRPPAVFTVRTTLETNGTSLKILWTKAIDPDGDAVTYSIVTKDTLAKNLNDTTYIITNLDYDIKVEGKIIAKDSKGLKTEVGFSATTPKKSSSKSIISFSFNTQIRIFEATIDTINREITVNLPFSPDITKLAPTITFSNKATISPGSGVAQNFSKPVIYTVTAEDGTSVTYTAKITANKPTRADLDNIRGGWKNIAELRLELKAVDHTGVIWGEATQAGVGYLAKFENGKEYMINMGKSKVPVASINDMVEFENGIWGATAKGIFTISGKDTLVFNPSNSSLDTYIVKALDVFDNELYCLTETSIYKLDKMRWVKIASIENDKFRDFKVTKGVIYLVSDEFLYTYNKSFEKYTKQGATSFERINVDSKGIVWISNWWGMIKFENKTFTEYSYRTISDFPSAGLMNFIIAKDDIIWMAWGKHGVVVFDEGHILFNFTNGNSKLGSDNTNNIIYKDNTIYVGVFNYSFNLDKPNGVDKLELY